MQEPPLVLTAVRIEGIHARLARSDSPTPTRSPVTFKAAIADVRVLLSDESLATALGLVLAWQVRTQLLVPFVVCSCLIVFRWPHPRCSTHGLDCLRLLCLAAALPSSTFLSQASFQYLSNTVAAVSMQHVRQLEVLMTHVTDRLASMDFDTVVSKFMQRRGGLANHGDDLRERLR